MTNLRKKYKEEIIPKLQKELEIKNPLDIPSFSKIVINTGVKSALIDKKKLQEIATVLGQIVGQKPKITRAKKSIAAFKLREGEEVGLVVTLRGKRMYDFYEKLVNIVLARLKDFHGVKRTSFDSRGNYTLGFAEYSVFPEIDLGKIDPNISRQGLEITIVTTAENKKEGIALLEAMGMPFVKSV